VDQLPNAKPNPQEGQIQDSIPKGAMHVEDGMDDDRIRDADPSPLL
jgi:hypothetical protein